MSKKAVLLLSGGLDSATTLALAREQGFEVYALSFRYGQRHAVELEAAQRVATALGAVEHKIADIDLRLFGGSALTADIAVPKDRSDSEISHGIPITYVPARNTIFLSFALAWAEVLKAYDIFIGVNALDYSGYPDCRPEFIAAFEKTANLATAYGVGSDRDASSDTSPLGEVGAPDESSLRASTQGATGEGQASAPSPLTRNMRSEGLHADRSSTHVSTSPKGEVSEQVPRIRIHTPIIHMTKAEIIREGLRLGVDYSMTISCYDPSPEGTPCGHCDSCQLRAKGFRENGHSE